jgi:CubicO group peptidase (beta-lactamase class C family)
MTYRVWAVLLFGLALTGCVPDARLKIPYNDAPAVLEDGWPIATPEAQAFDRAGLRRAYESFFSEDDYVTARSLLVVRNGYLIAEGYCRDPRDIRQQRAIQSATKSVTSLLTGIAIDLGYLDDLGRTLYSIMPDEFGSDPAKLGITLFDLMTMKSGIDFNNDDFTREMEFHVRGDGAKHILAKPMIHEPGTVFNYQDCDPHLLGAALQRLTGSTLEQFAKSRLFEKIGITNYVWLKHHDGTTYGAYGLYLVPRDLARIGKLVAQRGRWNDEQVVSEQWIDLSTSRQSEVDPVGTGLGFEYGLYWWRIPEIGAFTAYGHGGQYILVVPAKNLVIVMTAEPDTNGDTAEIRLEQFVVLARVIIDSAG